MAIAADPGKARRLIDGPLVPGAAGAVLFLLLLEALPRSGVVDARFLPPLSEMIAALRDQAATATFWQALGQTLTGWLTGLAVAAGSAIVAGTVIGSHRLLRRFTASTIEFLRPIPSVALIPLAALIYGTTMRSTLMLVIYASFWQMLLQVVYGVQDVDPVVLDTARSYRFGTFRKFRSVYWPSALPYVLTGFRLCASVALILEMTGELIMGTPGLGRVVGVAQASGAVASVYALVIVTGVLGVIVNFVTRSIERRALRWHPSVRREVVV